MALTQKSEIKTISSSGQISLGKAFAGKRVMLERLEDGRWVVTPVQVIPEHLLWAHTPEVTARLERHLDWVKGNPNTESDLDELEQRLRNRD
jgi:CRISPR/Cas system CMR subunit Cmr4 (Cas7 group RAMP superfamily)